MKHLNGFWMAAALGAMLSATGMQAATIHQRQERQQDRIAQGVASGQLTARETARLETREARLNRTIRNDRQEHNGHLTPHERVQIDRRQDALSRSIYRDKHNAVR